MLDLQPPRHTSTLRKAAVAKDRDRRCNGVEPGLWEASAQHRERTPSDSTLRSPQTALIRALVCGCTNFPGDNAGGATRSLGCFALRDDAPRRAIVGMA